MNKEDRELIEKLSKKRTSISNCNFTNDLFAKDETLSELMTLLQTQANNAESLLNIMTSKVSGPMLRIPLDE